MRWLKAHEIMKELQISRPTLKRWKDKKLIQFKQLSQKLYLYNPDSLLNKEEEFKDCKNNVIYARVSSSKQKDDLTRQILLLKEYCLKQGVKVDRIYSDIGSGMNSNRKDFNILLSDIFNNKIDRIYISYKDRLTRFGFDYFENICDKFGVKIEILDEDEFRDPNVEKELTEDLIAIIHHYSMKLYNGRKKKFNKIKNELNDK